MQHRHLMDEPPAWAPGLRFATADLAPIEFGFRERPEDFVVHELPAFEPSGTGDHLLLEIEKRGVPTPVLADRLARTMGVARERVGFAGRKDAYAVARQRFSVALQEGQAARALEAARDLALTDARVLEVWRHHERLSLGELAGNRFTLLLRDVSTGARHTLERALELLDAEGLPNYVGDQRFGRSGSTWLLGRELLVGREEAYVQALCAPEHATPSEAQAVLHAAVRGTAGQRRALTAVASALPPDLRRLAVQLARRPRDIASAVRAVSKRDRRFHLNALQARVFNRLCAWRVEDPGPRPEDRCVEVEAGSTARTSPTAPLPGRRNLVLEGHTGEQELASLALEGLVPRDFERRRAGIRLKGDRRPLRAPLGELALGSRGGDIRLQFTLPPGSYATVLVAELRKTFQAPSRGAAGCQVGTERV